jgi:hypothetical protein
MDSISRGLKKFAQIHADLTDFWLKTPRFRELRTLMIA